MKNKTWFFGMDVSKLTIDFSLIDAMDKVLLKGQFANNKSGITSLMKSLKKAGYGCTDSILFGVKLAKIPHILSVANDYAFDF